MKPSTLAARGTHPIDPTTGALVPPIHTSTTFARDPDYRLLGDAMYARDDAPTLLPAETLLAQLEEGAEALLFGSGMAAAVAAITALPAPGSHIVVPRVIYWGLRAWLA